MKTHLNYLASAAIFLIIVLVTTGYSQTIQSDEAEEIIKIETNLVKLSFIEPETKVNRNQVFVGVREVTDFKLVTPADETKISRQPFRRFNQADSDFSSPRASPERREAIQSLGDRQDK